jgi:hypothetical protein
MTDEASIARLPIRHSVSADAVRTVLRALHSGSGRMAQFSHADFGARRTKPSFGRHAR